MVHAVVLRVEDAVFGVDVLHDADDETVGADLDGLMLGAFESDGRFFDTRGSDTKGRGGGESGCFEFALAVGKGGCGGDHGIGELRGDEVNDEFAVLADVAGGVFGDGRLSVFGGFLVAGGEGDKGRVRSENVEEGVRRGIDAAQAVDGGDPGDRAGSDERGEDFVAVRRFERREVDFHEGRIGS